MIDFGHRSPTGDEPVYGAHDTYRRWLGPTYDMLALDCVLSCAAVERLPGDPAWLLLIGGSGAAKTETVATLPGVITSTVASEGALLSATSNRDKTADANGGLLRRLEPRGLLVIKDFTSILSMSRDARASVLAALREVADGYWQRNVGTDGGKTLTWRGRVVLIGASTTAYDTAHAAIAAMGDRWALCRLDSTRGRLEAARQAMANIGHEERMRKELAAASSRVLASVDAGRCDGIPVDEVTGYAELVTYGRTAVERDHKGDIIDAHAPEMPTRFAKMLAQIGRGGLSIGLDRDRAMRVVRRVARDSLPPLRLALMRDLLDYPGSTVKECAERVVRPWSTVDRELQALHAIGLLVVTKAGGGRGWSYDLSTMINPHVLNSLSPEMAVQARRGVVEERLDTAVSGEWTATNV